MQETGSTLSSAAFAEVKFSHIALQALSAEALDCHDAGNDVLYLCNVPYLRALCARCMQ